MKRTAARFLTLVEAFAFAAFIAYYIWRLQYVHPESWIALLVWPLVSFVVHRDTPKTIGWRADNLGIATRRAAPVFGILIVVLCITGLLLGALHRFPTTLFHTRHFLGYFSFCLLQQVALNSFLANRLFYAMEDSWRTSLLVGVLFAALHWPNPVLVPLTFIGGAVMALLFIKERNILPLTLGQTILGTLVWWAFPIAWHHSMRVGPGYYSFLR